MVRREESDSGLRAGFVRGDGRLPRQRKKDTPPKIEKEPPAKPEPVKVEPAPKPKEPAGPTLTMQGVSGKKITGVVKVVKKAARKPAPPAEPAVEPAAEPVAEAVQPAEVAASAPAPAPVVKAPEEKKQVAKAKVVPETSPEPPRQEAEKEPAQKALVQPAPEPVKEVVREEKPAAPAATEEEKPRRQTGGPLKAGARPPRGPQSGQYLRKDRMAAPARPAAAEQRPRPERPRRLQIPDVPEEVKEKPADTRTAFTARDADRTRRDPRPDSREARPAAARTPAADRDKHRSLKRQAQELSGKPVDEALSEATMMDTVYRQPSRRGRQRRPGRRGQRQSAPAKIAVLTNVKLPESLTVKEFAEAIKKTAAEVIKSLMKLGVMATLNQVIDFDTAALVAAEFNITAEQLVTVTEEDILFDDSEDDVEALVARPPVVVVMGHVDHGKTSILDRFRSSSVAAGEAGGITQHIGAYTVKANSRQLTFLDTPGHEAFTTMRARGAQVTDIAILVVAADDGVMPQTIEAINHARAANTQIVVAINKIDLPGANLDRVKQELAAQELIPEEWGGTTVMVPVSAKTGEGMDELLEMVLLTADIMDLKADPTRQAKGTVIESKLDRNRGPVATVLVQRGTLKTGDTLVTGSIIGHIRAMTDDRGQTVEEAGPSIPVEVLGLPEVPDAGELFYAVTDDRVARNLVERRRAEQREQQLRSSSRMTLDSLFSQMAAGEVKDLNIVVKADVQGSVEAVRQSLEKLSGDEVRVNVIHGAVGAINESDVRLAEVSNAIVIGFNVRPAANVTEIAADVGVDLRMYRVIYQAIDDIEAAMKGLLAPTYKEVVLGHAEVRQIFRVSGIGTVAGCFVLDGKILRSCDVRLVRDGIVIHEGKLASLRRFKDDVREVAAGYECGIGLERFNDLKENDIIEAFTMEEIERS